MAHECHILYLLYIIGLDGKCSAVVKQITVSLSSLQLPSHNPLRIICATEQSIVSCTGKVKGGGRGGREGEERVKVDKTAAGRVEGGKGVC